MKNTGTFSKDTFIWSGIFEKLVDAKFISQCQKKSSGNILKILAMDCEIQYYAKLDSLKVSFVKDGFNVTVTSDHTGVHYRLEEKGQKYRDLQDYIHVHFYHDFLTNTWGMENICAQVADYGNGSVLQSVAVRTEEFEKDNLPVVVNQMLWKLWQPLENSFLAKNHLVGLLGYLPTASENALPEIPNYRDFPYKFTQKNNDREQMRMDREKLQWNNKRTELKGAIYKRKYLMFCVDGKEHIRTVEPLAKNEESLREIFALMKEFLGSKKGVLEKASTSLKNAYAKYN